LRGVPVGRTQVHCAAQVPCVHCGLTRQIRIPFRERERFLGRVVARLNPSALEADRRWQAMFARPHSSPSHAQFVRRCADLTILALGCFFFAVLTFDARLTAGFFGVAEPVAPAAVASAAVER